MEDHHRFKDGVLTLELHT
ncbi:hypothetical protein D030_1748A, partial [Vibrio parahaemolyticus AQ3810]